MDDLEFFGANIPFVPFEEPFGVDEDRRARQRIADANFKLRHPERRKEQYNRAARKSRAADREPSRQAARTYSAKNPAYIIWNAARHRARKYDLQFSIMPEDLLPLPTICPIFKTELEYGGGKGKGYNPNAASLDRRDPKLGYVKENIVVMSRRANSIKNDGTAAEHRAIADWMDGGSNGLGR